MVFTLGPERKRRSSHRTIFLCHSFSPPVRSCHSDPLVSRGRHFGRTVHALCGVHTILTNGLLRLGELADEPDEVFTLE